MAGHSKWHNIQKRKGVQDAKRSKIFTATARMIIQAVKKSGITNPDENPSLRLALDKARAVNMPSDNIARAIARGAGKSDEGRSLEEILYEGYGPYGVGILASVLTDNKQRTSSEIRFLLSSHGGSLAGPGAASYLFTKNETEYTATIPIELTAEQMESLLALIDELEAHDDVDGVWHNGIVTQTQA